MAQPIAPPTRSTSALEISWKFLKTASCERFSPWNNLNNKKIDHNTNLPRSFFFFPTQRWKNAEWFSFRNMWTLWTVSQINSLKRKVIWNLVFQSTGRTKRKKTDHSRLFFSLTTNYSTWNHPLNMFMSRVESRSKTKKWRIFFGGTIGQLKGVISWDSWTVEPKKAPVSLVVRSEHQLSRFVSWRLFALQFFPRIQRCCSCPDPKFLVVWSEHSNSQTKHPVNVKQPKSDRFTEDYICRELVSW